MSLFWHRDLQNSTEPDVLDALQPHPNLRALDIINHGGTTGPSWLFGDISIKMLGSLHLEGVSWGTLPPFGQLLHLSSLTLINISVLREIRPGCGGVTDRTFAHLKQIVLDRLPELVQWVGGVDAHSLSRLEYISCTSCPNLCAVPFLDCSVSYTNLSNFVIEDCPKLSLPPMPHRSTLTSFCVSFSYFTRLSYDKEGMVIGGCSGELALDNLHIIETLRIENVSHIPLTVLNKLKSLRGLELNTCNITCHGLQDLTWLQSLAVKDCGNFFPWPTEVAHTIKPFPASIERLEIVRESSMQSMALLSNLTCLTILELVDCENLTVDRFNPLITANLESLKVYNRGKCLSRSISADLFSKLVVARTNISFPAGSFQLRVLTVDCISAVLVAPICTLLAATLRNLQFRYDERAESFTGEEDGALQLLTSLCYLKFEDCPNMPCLPQGLHGLPSLSHLKVEGCPQIRSLPKGGFPTSLSVSVSGCSHELNEQLRKLMGTNPDLDVCIY